MAISADVANSIGNEQLAAVLKQFLVRAFEEAGLESPADGAIDRAVAQHFDKYANSFREVVAANVDLDVAMQEPTRIRQQEFERADRGYATKLARTHGALQAIATEVGMDLETLLWLQGYSAEAHNVSRADAEAARQFVMAVEPGSEGEPSEYERNRQIRTYARSKQLEAWEERAEARRDAEEAWFRARKAPEREHLEKVGAGYATIVDELGQSLGVAGELPLGALPVGPMNQVVSIMDEMERHSADGKTFSVLLYRSGAHSLQEIAPAWQEFAANVEGDAKVALGESDVNTEEASPLGYYFGVKEVALLTFHNGTFVACSDAPTTAGGFAELVQEAGRSQTQAGGVEL